VASNNNIVGQAYTNPGFLTNMTTSVYDAAFQNAQYFSDYYVRNGSFLRLDNVTLGYTFNDITPQNINVRVYGTVRNALLVTDYEGLDPEMESGIDNNLYPRPRTYVFGLSMNF
jgi:iron complex outermembrane receptor protein